MLLNFFSLACLAKFSSPFALFDCCWPRNRRQTKYTRCDLCLLWSFLLLFPYFEATRPYCGVLLLILQHDTPEYYRSQPRNNLHYFSFDNKYRFLLYLGLRIYHFVKRSSVGICSVQTNTLQYFYHGYSKISIFLLPPHSFEHLSCPYFPPIIYSSMPLMSVLMPFPALTSLNACSASSNLTVPVINCFTLTLPSATSSTASL